MTNGADADETGPAGRRAGEVFAAFAKLGVTAFGGPIAHLGYFRDEFVARRGWLSEADYADLVALCQFLPGPTSSQVGFALGLMRAGWLGALAAFAAFTLPSALILFAFAATAASIDGPVGTGVLDGLKIVAVAVVAQAVLGMARTLCPDPERASIAVGAVAVLAFLPGGAGMAAAIGAGAAAGLLLGRGEAPPGRDVVALPVRPWQAALCLALFAALLVCLPLVGAASHALQLFDGFYRSGALVFGGGHVVLPLLEAETVARGWIAPDAFLAGYGAVQAVPGPLFTFAAYLGAALGPAPNGAAGAAIALVAVFLPGFLILLGALPFWDGLRRMAGTRSAMQGANAAVVGILGAALHTPIFTGAIDDMRDFALALSCFALLVAWGAPPWQVVIVAALGGTGLSVLA